MTKILTIGYHDVAEEYFVSESLNGDNREYFSPEGIKKQVRIYLEKEGLKKRQIRLIRSIHSKDKNLDVLIEALQTVNPKIKN